MGYRKFFYGDTVLMNGAEYQSHDGHTGRVTGTLIRPHHIYYRVACGCGNNISPKADQMDLVTTPHEDPDPQSVHEIRMNHFLQRVGVEPKKNSLKRQVKESLATCKKMRDSTIMSLRFGLDGSAGKTQQEIGKEYGITKARVQQIEARVLRTIRRAMEKEKHENRVGTPA